MLFENSGGNAARPIQRARSASPAVREARLSASVFDAAHGPRTRNLRSLTAKNDPSVRAWPVRTSERQEMTEPREATDVDALGEIMLIQGTMQRQFLRVMLRRLATDVPSFNAELLLAELDLLRENLETRPRPLGPARLRAEGMGAAFGDGARRDRLDPREAGAALGFRRPGTELPPRLRSVGLRSAAALASAYLSGCPRG